MGAERLDQAGWDRLHQALRHGDPDGEVQDAWVAREYVLGVYLTNSPAEAERLLEKAIDWCCDRAAGPELRTLAKTLRRWRQNVSCVGRSNDRCERTRWSPDSGSSSSPYSPRPEWW